MKFKLKKLTSVILSVALSTSLIALPAFSAADDYESLSSEVGYVYNYVDNDENLAVNDLTVILGTGNKLSNILNVPNVKTGVDVASLLTANFKANYLSENAAKEDLLKLLGLSLAVYYSESEDALQAALINAEASVKPILQKAMGISNGDIETFTEKWFDLFLLTRKDAQDTAHTIANMLPVWASGQLDELFDAMDRMQIKSIDNRLNAETEETFGKTYADVKDAFDGLDWTVENLVAACRSIIDFVDTSNSGEFALIKAAARSSAVVSLNGTPLDLLNAGNDLDDEANIYRIDPEQISADTDYEIKLEVMGRDVTNLVNFNSSNSDLVVMSANDAEKVVIMTIKKAKKGTSNVILMRDPGSINDWIARMKVVVAYEIAKADAPVWSTETEGAASWTPVPNAQKYVAKLYKTDDESGEDICVGEKEVNGTTVNFSEMISQNGNGEYKVTVTACGDIAEEVGEESEKSAALSHTEGLEQVGQPVWDGKTLKWDGVTGATNYTIYLYKGNAKVPFTSINTVAVDGTNSYDCFEIFTGNYKSGTFYAVVQAKSADKLGAASVKSEALVIASENTFTGNVKLEAYEIGTTQEDNSGIKVTLEEDVSITTVTDEDGNYTISGDLPAGEYNLIFEKDCYLIKKTTFVTTGGDFTVDPVVMLYGDFANSTSVGIHILDLSVISECVGLVSSDPTYNINMDIDKDGYIDLIEFSVVVRNYGEFYAE